MRLSSFLPIVAAFVAAAGLAVVGAVMAADWIERSAHETITDLLEEDGQGWAEVSVDGLQVRLSGTAPDEATRFRAISLAGLVVDAAQVIDAMQVDPGEPVEPPRFAIEILRNDDGISLIGLVPGTTDRAAIAARVAGLSGGAPVTDLLESADHPAPERWDAALDYALDALADLPRSKISVAADRIAITAISDSPSDRRRLETALARAAPDDIPLALKISAPRPVISPFVVRFLIDGDGARFDACTAHTEAGRDAILSAATAAGLAGKTECRLGLGAPSPLWPDAVAMGIAALAELGGGTLTVSDTEVTLLADEATSPGLFDRLAADLAAELPEAFSLTAVLPEPPAADEGEGPPEIVATLSPEGLLRLRGRITDDRLRAAVEGFARATIPGADLDAALEVDDGLPEGWAMRVFAGLEALSYLNNGSLLVRPDTIEVRGATGRQEAREEISRLLNDKLGQAGKFAVGVQYQERLDPLAALPTPEECVAEINAILTSRQITFAPGSDEIDADARDSVDRIAETMVQCRDVAMEIGGHTDSQGRESMNQQLSQRRAEAVLEALRARRVLVANLTAKGYGEAEPIADNKTAEGREANRRIEFRLLVDGAVAEAADTAAAETEDPDE